MIKKNMEILGTVVAIAVFLGAVSSIGHAKERKNSACRLARAEICEQVGLDEGFDECFDEGFNGGFNEGLNEGHFSDICCSNSEKLHSMSNDESVRVAGNAQLSLFPCAKSAYVMENQSKIPVFEKEALKRLPIASMCKIMTLLLAFEGVEQGILQKDELITVSENAASMGGSQVFLEAHAAYPFTELIKSIVVCSANDSCVAIAERISGNTDIFVEKMNTRAKELGCENTLFANCTGLPQEPQYSCARDVALMMSELLKHEEYFDYAKTWMDTFQHPQGRTTEITNTNRLVRFYDGCDGGKTGFTNEAGFCLAATAKRGNMRLISVVIGEKDSKTRFKEISESFDYTFANYTMQTVVDANLPCEDALAVCGGKIKSIAVKPQRDGVIFAKRGEQVKVDTQVCLNEIVKAPIRQGDVVGEIRLFREGVEFDRIPVVACENVERANYWDSVMDVARDWSFAGK